MIKNRGTGSISTLLLIPLVTCAPAPSPPVVFDCGGQTFAVWFESDSARIAISDDTLSLPQAISASGARYSDGVVEFWEHQGTARLVLPDTTLEGCQPIREP